jgi:hypothetical protein
MWFVPTTINDKKEIKIWGCFECFLTKAGTLAFIPLPYYHPIVKGIWWKKLLIAQQYKSATSMVIEAGCNVSLIVVLRLVPQKTL